MERSGTNALGVRRPISAAALSFRASAHTGVGIRLLAGAMPTSSRRELTKTGERFIMHLKDAAINGRRLVTAPKGGDIHVFRVYDSYSGSFDLDTSPTTEKQKPPLRQVTVFVSILLDKTTI